MVLVSRFRKEIKDDPNKVEKDFDKLVELLEGKAKPKVRMAQPKTEQEIAGRKKFNIMTP